MFVWDVATGATSRRLPGHLSKIHAVEFNEDATVVASGAPVESSVSMYRSHTTGSYDSTVRLWDLRSVFFIPPLA